MSISLTDALAITEDGSLPFGIKFISCDLNRNRGGEVIDLPMAFRTGASHNRKQNDTIVVKAAGREQHPYTVHNHLILEVNKQEIFI